MSIKNIKQIIEQSNIVKYIDKHLLGLKEPDKNLTEYLNNIQNVNDLDNEELEEYLAVMTAWQNYYHELMVRTDVVKNIATQQSELFYSIAVKTVEGSVNLRKDLAKGNEDFVKAEEIKVKAESLYESYKFKYDTCERTFKLISRILTKRLNIKYDI